MNLKLGKSYKLFPTCQWYDTLGITQESHPLLYRIRHLRQPSFFSGRRRRRRVLTYSSPCKKFKPSQQLNTRNETAWSHIGRKLCFLINFFLHSISKNASSIPPDDPLQNNRHEHVPGRVSRAFRGFDYTSVCPHLGKEGLTRDIIRNRSCRKWSRESLIPLSHYGGL